MSSPGEEQGSGLVLAAVSLLVATLVAVVVVDLGAVTLGHARATAAADAAALAAAAATDPFDPASPLAVATRVARASDAALEACDCRGPEVEVTVSRALRTIALRHLGVREVRATSRATMVEPP